MRPSGAAGVTESEFSTLVKWRYSALHEIGTFLAGCQQREIAASRNVFISADKATGWPRVLCRDNLGLFLVLQTTTHTPARLLMP